MRLTDIDEQNWFRERGSEPVNVILNRMKEKMLCDGEIKKRKVLPGEFSKILSAMDIQVEGVILSCNPNIRETKQCMKCIIQTMNDSESV